MAHTAKVLLVESETSLRTELVAELAKRKIEALEARDAAEGLAIAENRLPDLILIDAVTLVQDGIDGQGLLAKLRKREWCLTVPILFIDGIVEEDSAAWGTPENPTFIYEKEAMDVPAIVREIENRLKEAAIIG